MKKIIRLAAIVAAAAALFSCQEKPTPTPDNTDKPGQEQQKPAELNQNIKFTIELTDVTEETAKFKIKHDGVKADTWHYFPTTETDITKAIETEVAAIMAEGKSLQSSTNKNITVRGLEAETTYSLVVFGLSTKGEVYGQPATFEFTTTAAPLEGFQVNPAWTVTYIGAGEVDGKSYEHVISVNSTDSNTYLTSVISKSDYDTYGIEAIAESEIAYWTEYVNQFNQANGTNYDLSALLYTGSVEEGWTLEGGEYVALAIGATAAGATGYYAASEPFAVVEADMSEGYAAWLGDWTITGANGLTQQVTFSKGKANETFIMTGYEGEDATGLDVTVNWMEEEGCWAIYNQKIGTYDFGQYGPGDVWFLGEGEDESIYLDELPICIGGMFEDGSLGAIGYEETYELEDGTPMTYKVVVMEYLAYLTEHGQLSYLTGTYQTGYPTFPLTFTPATTATMHSAKEFKGVKKAFNPLAPNTFKAYDFNKSAKVSFTF
jgi:hypothetical protein